MKNYIAFFDLDNTILNTSSGKLFVRYSFEKNVISFRELLLGLFIAVVNRMGLSDTEKTINKWAMKYKGTSESELIDFTRNWFQEMVVNHFRRGARDEINFHNRNGGKTVILSAATAYICNPVKDYLNMSDVLCTDLEVADGKLTGRIIGRYCYGEEKLLRAAEYCRLEGFQLERAYYYADSFSDLPVLERVMKPICVSPDRRLARIAQKRKWEIREW
jgi:HAD superfamily hydrolase (TIGR01490 family)